MPVLIGIDIGSQSLKAVVCSERLEVLAEDSVAYHVDYPRPTWAQQDPQLWLDALPVAISQALAKAELSAQEVSAIGVAGQLDGCIAVDAGGTAQGPALIWSDRRADKQSQLVDSQTIRQRCGLVADASHMGAKIAWLKENALGIDGARFEQPVSFVVRQLCGRSVMDHALASTTMLYSLHARDYDEELLAAFGVSRSEIPEIAEAWDVAGTLSEEGALRCGLPAGIVVAVGSGDDFVMPFGAGLHKPGQFVGVLGTAEVVGSFCVEAKIDEGGLLETHAYLGGGYFVENPGWLSGGAHHWISTIVGKSFDEVESMVDDVPPGCDGLTFIPALTGAMAPRWEARARGSFYGLTSAHGAGHLCRAVMEGCAFAMRDVRDRCLDLGLEINELWLLGGGAKSPHWTKLRADVLQLSARVPEVLDTCAVGAAACAALAGGLVKTPADATQQLSEGSHMLVSHDLANRGIYDQAYERYQRLFRCLEPMF